MNRLSTILAAVAAVSLFASGPVASAASKTTKHVQGKHVVHCVPGRPSPGCPPHAWHPQKPHPYWSWGWGYHPWPYGYYHPFHGNPYYDDDYHVANRMTCNYAKGLMARRGYRSVKATDCTGTYYGFTGLKNGHKYRITLNSYTGRYSVKRI